MNNFRMADIKVGLKASFEKRITKEMENAFREMTGDVNPLHRDDAFARERGNGTFRGHVSFGMLTASLYSTLAGVYLPGENSLIHSFEELSFLKPVYVGDMLHVEGEVVDKLEDLKLIRVKAVIRNQDGKTVSKAKMKILVMR